MVCNRDHNFGVSTSSSTLRSFPALRMSPSTVQCSAVAMQNESSVSAMEHATIALLSAVARAGFGSASRCAFG